MFNFVWTFIYKIYDVSVWSTNHVEPLWDFSNRSVYILLVFRAVFIYIIFIVWHYESYHLYCVVRAIYIGLGPVLFFTMPCHVHVHMTEEHIVSLRYTSSFCLRYPGSIKTHSRYISDRVKSSSSHFLLSPKCTCSTLFFNQFGPFLTLVFAFFSNYCYQASFSYKHLPSVTMFCNVNLFYMYSPKPGQLCHKYFNIIVLFYVLNNNEIYMMDIKLQSVKCCLFSMYYRNSRKC